MESRAPAVVAVVVTTGPGPGLDAAVASLAAQDYEELSLLVVANGEVEHVATRVAAIAPNAFVTQLSENRGFGAACNEASLMVDGAAFYLFCHDDVRLATDAVQQMVETAFRANAGVVTPKFVHYDDDLILLHVGQTCDRFGVVRERVEEGEVDHGQQDLERDVFVAPGGATLVRTDLFKSLRGFDPLIPILGEDLDLCWRAQVAGARVVVAPLAVVAHRETIATGERSYDAIGTRRASRQDLQRRHQLLVVATGWGPLTTVITLTMLLVMDAMELVLSVLGRDHDRTGAIIGSWRWLLRHRRRVRERRRQRHEGQVLSDSDLRRLQVGGASRLKSFTLVLAREGLDRALGVIPPSEELIEEEEREAQGIGFSSGFTDDEGFDEVSIGPDVGVASRPLRFLTSFRSQAAVVVVAVVVWLLGSRNLVATHLPLVGRLTPLDSWWSTWRHFFASWSANGVGTTTPGMPGYGVLGFAGTFVLGRMGILPRLALIFAVPLGALGVGRFLRGKVSNRARVVGALSYLAVPVGVNMISQGRVDVLVVVAGLPFVVRRIFEVMDVSGFRQRPYSEPVAFGQRGWRTSEAGQRMVLFMLVALMSAMAPATLVVAILVVLGVAFARLLEPDPQSSFRGNWRLAFAIVLNVAILLLPLTIDTVLAGRRAPSVFGLARGPWSTPSFSLLVRGSDGVFGGGWAGWLMPAAALFALVLCKDERRRIATKVASIAALSLALAALVSGHLLGSFAPDLDVVLALYGVMLAALVGLGVSALELDLRGSGFGWRQVVGALTIVVVLLASLPLLASLVTGRFNLPTTSVAESLSALAPSEAGGYRVLWLGDPAVLPVAGWSVAPGLAAATSMNGLPGGDSLFAPPDSGPSDVLLNAVHLALDGATVRLGALLADAGVSTIVVMNAAAPELQGVQTVPLHPVPGVLMSTLSRQVDLSQVLSTQSVTVYSNSVFHGITAQSVSGSALRPVFTSGSNTGPVHAGAALIAGYAPADAFTLHVGSLSVPQTSQPGWAQWYKVPTTEGVTPTATLSLNEFPLNGIIALFTLVVWLLMWLGFGWVHRLEWLFTPRRRQATRARHTRTSND